MTTDTRWYANDAVTSTDLWAHLLTNDRDRGMWIAVCGKRYRKWAPVEMFARPEAFTRCSDCAAALTGGRDG